MTDAQLAPPDANRTVSRLQEALALLLTLAGLCVAVALAAAARGFHQDDDITHYLLAREGWTDAFKAWHNWGRPGYTLPVLAVAHYFGMLGCRIFSAVQTAGIAYLAYRIARLICPPPKDRPQGLAWAPAIAPALAPAMVWAQPLAMMLAHTTLTETPAALYLTLGAWLVLRGNGVWGCVAMSPMFITRYELMALAPVFAAYLVWEALTQAAARDGRSVWAWASVRAVLLTPWLWAAAAAMCWAPLLYIVAGKIIHLPEYLTLVHQLTRKFGGQYGSAPWNHYWIGWMLEAAGGGVLALAAAGALLRNRRAVLVAALPLALVSLHMVIYMRGAFESGGYMRFLIPVTGMTAALAALGIGALVRMRDRMAILMALAVLGFWLYWVGQRDQWLLPVPLGAVIWILCILGIVAPALLLGGLRSVRERFTYAYITAGVLMAAHSIGLIRMHPPDLWLQLVMSLVTLAIYPIVAVLFSIPFAYARVARVAGWCVLCMALYAAYIHIEVRVKPLPLEDVMWVSGRDAVAEIEKGPYADRPALSTHPLCVYLREDKTKSVESYEGACLRWANAKPGTLFFWDNKYGMDTNAPDGVGPLYRALLEHGRAICTRETTNEYDTGQVVVFVRKDDTPTTQPSP